MGTAAFTKSVNGVYYYLDVCRRFIYYKGDTGTHAQGTDPKVALGAYGELPMRSNGAYSDLVFCSENPYRVSYIGCVFYIEGVLY